MHVAGPRAAPIVETAPIEPPVPPSAPGDELKTGGVHFTDLAVLGAPALAAESDETLRWFDGTALKLSGADDDKSNMRVDPNACVYPDAFLRNLAGGRDDCGLLRPGADESAIFTLPFFALTGWILVICAVAALYRFRREWRVRRWLGRMRAKGFVPSPPNARRAHHRRSRRSGRHRSASRRYAS
jgi:hypothetical protein